MDTFSLAWKLTVFTLKLAFNAVKFILTGILALFLYHRSKKSQRELKQQTGNRQSYTIPPARQTIPRTKEEVQERVDKNESFWYGFRTHWRLFQSLSPFWGAAIEAVVFGILLYIGLGKSFSMGMSYRSNPAVQYASNPEYGADLAKSVNAFDIIWKIMALGGAIAVYCYIYPRHKKYCAYLQTASGVQSTEDSMNSEDLERESPLLLGQNTILPFSNRETHMYCVGKTGSGKSRAMQYWLTQDIEAGRGCAFIDAHGDVIDDYLASLAKKFIEKGIKLEDVEKQPRMEDLIIIDPTDPDFAVGINPLETYGTFTPTQMGDILSDAIKKMWGFEKGEAGRMEEILAFTGHVLAKNGLTLMEADPFLTDEENFIPSVGRRMKPNELRQTLLKNVDNPVVKNYWEKIYPGLAEHEELVDPGKRRLRKFIGDERIADIIGQKKKTLNIREAMDSKRIILCKIPIGKMLEKGSFFGALLVSLFQQAAMSRDKDASNPPFFLYIDEFHEFVSLAFEKILSGARKYGLHFILAHQYKRQVEQNIQDVIIKNTKAIIAFDIDAEDAEIMAKEFYEITCRMIRDTRRSFRLINLGGLQIPYFEETNDYYSKDEEIQLNANEFKKLQPRQFIVMQEGYEIPQGDITGDVPEIKKDERIKEYVQKIREISNRRWGLSKKQIREEILQRRKGLDNPANYLKEFLSEKKNDDTKTETKTG